MDTLKIEGLSHYYQDGEIQRYVLENISYEFKTGKFYSIVGASGSGKTTLLSLMAGLDTIQSGTISIGDKTLQEIGYEKYRNSKVGIVFQSFNLIKHMTALENVLVAMDITDNEMPAEKEKVALNLLDFLGIDTTKAGRFVNQLSGGEQQRVAIARALVTNVDFIFADEPTGNLDEDTEKEIIDIFKMLAHKHNKCVIVVTHANELANESDEIIRIKKGNLI